MSAEKGGEKRKASSAEKAAAKDGSQKKRRLDGNHPKAQPENKTNSRSDDRKQSLNASGSADNANESNGTFYLLQTCHDFFFSRIRRSVDTTQA